MLSAVGRSRTMTPERGHEIRQLTKPVTFYEVPSEELGKWKPDFSGPKKEGKANKAGQKGCREFF